MENRHTQKVVVPYWGWYQNKLDLMMASALESRLGISQFQPRNAH